MDSFLDQDDFEEDITLERLRRSVLNEIASPELLPYQTSVMEHFLSRLKEKSDIGDNISTEQEKKIVEIFKLDSERIKYYLQLYHRSRLFKIDKYHVSLLSNEENSAKLSASELKFAHSYKQILNRHFMDSFLKSIPERLRGTEEVRNDVNMVPEPNLDTPVFCRALSDIGEVLFEGELVPVNMTKGSVFVLRYRYIRPFLLQKQLELL
jgi:GINS complex subunit 4